MYSAIVNDKNTLGARVWIHLAHEALQILQELLSIGAAYFDVTIDDSVNCNWATRSIYMIIKVASHIPVTEKTYRVP